MPTLLDALRGAAELSASPRRPRWPWLAAAVAAITLALGVSLSSTAEADACAEVADELEPIWNADLRAELRAALGTRLPGDSLTSWAQQWVVLRTGECQAAKRAGRDPAASSCAQSLLRRFELTVEVLSTPHLRRGLRHDRVVSELPRPELCVDHPDDGDSGAGGLLELRDLDLRLRALISLDDLDAARDRQAEYMALARRHSARYHVERAIFWRGELRRLAGDLDGASADFARAYKRAQLLGADLFAGEAVLKLAAVAAERGELEVLDSLALVALGMYERAAPERVAEVHEVHGLGLLGGEESTRQRGVELLREAVESREELLVRHGGSAEPLSRAHESYARGLLAVGRASEALEYLELALTVHQDQFGHGTWRVSGILQQKFVALVQVGNLEDATVVERTILQIDDDAKDWRRYVDDAFWLADVYKQSGRPYHAIWPLRLGRDKAAKYGMVAELAEFDRTIVEIIHE
ncbi:hypothetical protein ENSA5_00810 [Enhygromyxa salina]|uniref:Tetratricopeptide repeat protein n=1 Tax=Enhygromyxa salina TaxID=215803 RepID=A0A2S9YKX0_9BACT|nr:hypothetical protein [Enhygromyxa salina]PRQ05761.1 hypothetical protein ENSA5_00810 [Enhygromyxa salina]